MSRMLVVRAVREGETASTHQDKCCLYYYRPSRPWLQCQYHNRAVPVQYVADLDSLHGRMKRTTLDHLVQLCEGVNDRLQAQTTVVEEVVHRYGSQADQRHQDSMAQAAKLETSVQGLLQQVASHLPARPARG